MLAHVQIYTAKLGFRRKKSVPRAIFDTRQQSPVGRTTWTQELNVEPGEIAMIQCWYKLIQAVLIRHPVSCDAIEPTATWNELDINWTMLRSSAIQCVDSNCLQVHSTGCLYACVLQCLRLDQDHLFSFLLQCSNRRQCTTRNTFTTALNTSSSLFLFLCCTFLWCT